MDTDVSFYRLTSRCLHGIHAVNKIDYIPRQRTAVSNSPPPSLLTAKASPNLSCINAASVHSPNNRTNNKYEIDVVAMAQTVPKNIFNCLQMPLDRVNSEKITIFLIGFEGDFICAEYCSVFCVDNFE